MLANALTGQVDIEVIFIKILAELSPFDVQILNIIYQKVIDNNFCTFKDSSNLDNIKLHLDILFSKQLIESPKITAGNTLNLPYPIQSSTHEAVSLTILGKKFLNSCKFGDKIELNKNS